MLMHLTVHFNFIFKNSVLQYLYFVLKKKEAKKWGKITNENKQRKRVVRKNKRKRKKE